MCLAEEGEWRLFSKPAKRRVAVLLYHHIGIPKPGTEHLALTVTPSKFRRQVRWLRWRGFAAITPAQWFAWCTTGEDLPKKPIIFTFDDAYSDTATHAFPVLEQFGFRSVVFVITRQAGCVTSWDGLTMMTIEELKHWAARGVEIGAHTRTHPDLTTIPDGAVYDEIIGSKKDLSNAGFKPLSFAYPFGYFDDRIRALVDGVFPLAFTCEEGLNDFRTDLLLLRRTMVHPGDTLLDIEFRAAFGKSPIDWLRRHIWLRSRLASALRRLRFLSH
jgi:peptidoglycan/xylan/chitin deacetylase (PgdA/CDA1 family)